jgi:hypothetical protein
MPEAAQTVETLSGRLAGVRRQIELSARRAGRTSAEVKLIAVSKTHPASLVREALAAGLLDFGENRVQEAEGKIAQLAGSGARWHLIGHLQANKARRAVKLFDVIHSVDSAALVARLDRLCAEEGRRELPLLAQIDLAGDPYTPGAFQLANIPPQVWVPRMTPISFSPSSGDQTTISYRLGQTALTRVQVLRTSDLQPSFTVVRTLQDWMSTAAGIVNLTWDGRSDAGDLAAPGTYGVRAQAQYDGGPMFNAATGWVAVT